MMRQIRTMVCNGELQAAGFYLLVDTGYQLYSGFLGTHELLKNVQTYDQCRETEYTQNDLGYRRKVVHPCRE